MIALLLLLSVALEWVLYTGRFMWRGRRIWVALPIMLTAFGAAGILYEYGTVLAFVVVLIASFRLFNQLRIAQGRMHQSYLLHSTRRTGLVLGFLQVATVLLLSTVPATFRDVLGPLAAVQLVGAAGVLLLTIRNLIKSRHVPRSSHTADRDMPTVTVAIPARNETADLEACLKSVVASDYPKLEILVLDDCSQDKTADVIKSFAQDGVRFIKGSPPEDRWLAKNQAYDRLASEANGEFILFCGVDVRLGPHTIKALVATAQERKKDMVSVLPRRMDSNPLVAFVQPMRYWWELALPRRYVNRPPVLSTCWVIRRKALQKLGGFGAVSHAIIPEGYFARALLKTDGYSFVRADDELDVQTRKSPNDQQDTAIRMHYPQIRRRPEVAFALTCIQIFLVHGPFVVVLSGIAWGFGATQALAAAACVLLVATHVLIVYVSNPGNVPIALVNFPVAAAMELAYGLISMYRYEFSVIDWKGRNICIPVMHVYPKLPPLDQK
ncbi:MAG TPA: glycosyltransferase family 2 protein [Verrucomicrobiae bacterium]|nr:glycosyltransferase family 2 protein [Verrucomicrobiae bacterium]